MEKFRLAPVLNEIAAVFNRNGKDVYLVGGAVRDLMLGRASTDWDLATNARPEEVMGFFKRVIPTGIKHGTVTVRYKGSSIEVTTFRTESEYSDGRRPDTIKYAQTIEEDLSRRDFTMNAAAVKLPEGKLFDPYGGQNDIRRRLIRCVGDAAERFSEDGLRPMRAVRFAAQLGFNLEGETLGAIRPSLNTTSKVAAERVREELDKTIASPSPQTGLVLMEETGLLTLFLPELDLCRGVEQKGYHIYDVLDHSLLSCAYAAQKGFSQDVRMAALFHDLGKPSAQKMGPDGSWTFYNHEKESASLAEGIMRRFRYPNSAIEKVCRLIRAHMFHYEDTWKDSAVRRFIVRTGEDLLSELFDLRMADAAGTCGADPSPALLLPFKKRIEAVLAADNVLSLKKLAVNGEDLIGIGVEPGKYIGIILKELFETTVDDPALNTKEKLLEIAKNIYQERYM